MAVLAVSGEWGGRRISELPLEKVKSDDRFPLSLTHCQRRFYCAGLAYLPTGGWKMSLENSGLFF